MVGRYKGSVIGLSWSLINPLLLLGLYTLIFSGVFTVRWGVSRPEDRLQFAILLFVGMIIHSFFAETLLRAPVLVLGNVSYVKKIIFPLEILPVVAVGASLFNALVSALVLVIAQAFLYGFIPWTLVFLPFVLLPLIVLTLGITWGLASLGVFLRDVAQPIGLIMTVLLFASPVFYPVSAFPEQLRFWLIFNPLTFPIEQARTVLIYGRMPDLVGGVIYIAVSVIIAWVGYFWFQKTRKGFANVL
ncbi:MAG: ABC transporter permease [Solidesulfovibrio sp.]